MSKIVDYKIVAETHDDDSSLQELVLSAIYNGWQPYGDVIVEHGTTLLSQAMVKYGTVYELP